MRVKNITIGSDPEVFLVDKITGDFIPAIGLIGGTKEEPKYISSYGHALQEDNVAAEINIPPVQTADEFMKNVNICLDYIREIIPGNLDISTSPSAEFKREHLNHPMAVAFGCDPDFNVYTKECNEGIHDSSSNIRTIGCHFHIGYDNPAVSVSEKIVMAMDIFLGIPSIFLDDDENRRMTYGRAGTFRFCTYGLEYRVLSGFILSDKKYVDWAFDGIYKAIDFVNSGKEVSKHYYNDIQNAINHSDKALAKIIMDIYKVNIPEFKKEKSDVRYSSV